MEDPRPPKPRSNRRPANKDPARKDLIRIKNALNGRTYKFACGTCISGHRAPQCDPVKHHDKVLFRRPDPGRPAKNCGHPASQGCNCKALRRLCCLLDEQQWAELKAGGVPTAIMYDDEDQLNDAVAEQKAAREQAQAHAQAQAQAQAHEQALQAANFYAYQHHSLSYRPTPPLLDMPFVPPDQMVQHNQYMAYHPVPQPPFDFYGNGFAPAPFQPTEYNPHFQHAEYNPQFQPAAVHPQHQNMTIQADTTALQLPAVHPQHQDMTTPADTTALQQFAAHMTQEKQIAAQPSANPTRSCCSTRREAAQPLMQQTSSQFNIPGSRPRDQFGCQTCASFDCTCVRCPELGQAPNGAWSQMCGRGGELDGELDGPVLLKLEQSSSQETQDIFQGIPEHQTPLKDFTHQPQDFSQQPQDVFHRQAQDFTHQPQDVFLQPQDFTQHHQEVFHQSQGFSQQPQDAFQGLSELQAPLEDYSQLPSLDVPHLPEFQFGQTQPTFDEALGYGDLSQISTRW